MSKRNQIHLEIESLSQKLSATNEVLSKSNDMSMLDVDLLRKTCIEIYDRINNLRLVMNEKVSTFAEATADKEVVKEEVLNRHAEPAEAEVPVDEKIEEEVEVEEEVTASTEVTVDEKVEEEIEVKDEVPAFAEATADEEIVKEEVADEHKEEEVLNRHAEPVEAEVTVDEKVEEEIEVKAENKEEEEKEVPVSTEVTADKEEVKKSIPMEEEEPQDLAGKFSATPINDLKKAISIAKKFEFINTLFQGNVEKYAYSIHFLNGLNSGDEAFQELNKLRVELEWEEEDRNYMELANLVRRRYLG